MSEPARTAQAVRKELKQAFPDIAFRVRSESFSMGDAVRVDYTDGVPDSDVRKIIAKYEYGQFNGMIDLYEMTNMRHDIPQVKYLTVNREISTDVRNRTERKLADYWGLDVNDDRAWLDKLGMWKQQAVWRELKDKSL